MKKLSVVLIACFGLASIAGDGCGADPVSASGVGKAQVTVPTGPDHLTTEQRNIRDRLRLDNEPGSVKHLYVISAYSGQVLLYSTVRGKVTSGGKRLTPTTVIGDTPETDSYFNVNIGGSTIGTAEVLQDDGTYGTSMDYLFWFDVRGVYHQHYVGGGQIVHISSQPIAVRSVIINLEVAGGGDGHPAATPAPAVP